MSPSEPPLGLPVETVLAPYAFWFELPNVLAVMVLPDIFNPDSVAVLGLYTKCESSVSMYCRFIPALFNAENVT